MYILTLLVSIIAAINLAFVHGEILTCLDDDAYVKKSLVRRRNSLYRLNIKEIPDEDGEVYSREYKVYVSSNCKTNGIKAVRILAMGGPDCGDGKFMYNKTDFYEFEDYSCPRVFQSKNAEVLQESHPHAWSSPSLTWSPSYCGCVYFRAIVIDGQHYYRDNETVENGPLSRRVCVKKQVNINSYVNALCSALKSTNAADAIGRPYFLNRHGIDVMTASGVTLFTALETRWRKNGNCCVKEGTGIIDCLLETRQKRIDNLCNNNSTDIPLVQYNTDYMLLKKSRCCHLRDKLGCFGEDGELRDITMETLLDYSKDDTHPINDLAIFGSVENKDILKYVTLVEIDPKTIKTDIYKEQLTYTTNDNATDSKVKTKKQKQEESKRKDTVRKQVKKQCCSAGSRLGSSLKTRLTWNAVRHCEVGARDHVRSQRNLWSNVAYCEDSFTTCCMSRWCCSKGSKLGSTRFIPSKEPMAVLRECHQDFEVFVRLSDLNNENRRSNLQSCENRFVSCCKAEVSLRIHRKQKGGLSGRNRSTVGIY